MLSRRRCIRSQIWQDVEITIIDDSLRCKVSICARQTISIRIGKAHFIGNSGEWPLFRSKV
jgi:hypothetical protein